jgi:hypothetical protein
LESNVDAWCYKPAKDVPELSFAIGSGYKNQKRRHEFRNPVGANALQLDVNEGATGPSGTTVVVPRLSQDEGSS